MKHLICSSFLIVFVAAAPAEKYTTKYDNINVDEIIKSDRLVKNYHECLMDRARCTNEGTELKKHVSDALTSGCEKCSDKQKIEVRKVIHHLVEKKPDYWTELQGKYDPEGVFRTKYADLIKSENLFERYTTKFDNVDVDQILKSDRLVKNYHECIMERGKCTTEASELKKHIGDALQTGCIKCSDKQKIEVRKVIHYLIEKKPESWKELQAKYDPEGAFKTKYADLIKEENLPIN